MATMPSERFELLARATQDLVYDWDIASGSIHWNEALVRYGHPHCPETATITFWEDLLHPEDRDRVLDGLKAAVDGRDALWSSEYRFRRADGTYAVVFDRGVFVRDGAGAALRMIGVMVDLSELRLAQSRLLMTDRLAAVGTLAAGVAHEINNPLSWTLNNVEVAADALSRLQRTVGAEERALVARALEALADARDGATRVARIVRDLKTFARSDDEARAPLELTQVLEATLALAHSEIRHRARVVRDYAEIPKVEGNESRLGQLFLNLLLNAAQALPEGAAERNEIRVSVRPAPDGRVEVAVSDTGPGIPPERLKHIFEPFYSTRANGTGLGLPICQSIARAHGGELLVESAPGCGTTVRALLQPAAHVDAPAEPGEAAPPQASKRARILVLDDEPLIGRALKRALYRHEVELSQDAREVLERARGGETWDLILCDVMMPEMGGMDFFEGLRALSPPLAERVVFMTAGAFTPRAAAFFGNLTNTRLEKPFDADAVERILAEMRSP